MSESNYIPYAELGHVPIKAWVRGVQLDDKALGQLRNVAGMPFVHKHVAVMPDAHWGMGATIGSVIATKGAIIPAAVGVDLGCGMMAVRTNLMASDLPDNLYDLRHSIERTVPHGRTENGRDGDKGAWNESRMPQLVTDAWGGLMAGYQDVLAKHPKLNRGASLTQLATLGTGNHFIEVCLDETQHVWVMLHSGSRGVGNRIGTYFIDKAKQDMKRWFINLPDVDLAYIPEGSEYFGDYYSAVKWAQEYARVNRELMMELTLANMGRQLKRPVLAQYDDMLGTASVVNCHHNYISKEHHYGTNVWVTRKGAVRAQLGDFGIIPGSMGAKSFIVRGLGNPESFNSCSHGAGRVMSRGEAKRVISADEHAQAVKGVECRLDADVIDESPRAYKDIDAVMAAQSDLVEIVVTLKQVLCVKG